ncbi:MAG TPA: DUF3352 domain-containing protein [Solirubrobacteraceae bacterium]
MRRLLISSLLAAAALVLPACGSSSSGGSGTTNPADAAPANSLLYANVAIRPSGDLKSSFDSAAKKVLNGADPGQKIQQGLNQALSQAKMNYKDDVKPWLGERAGFFLSSISSGSASGAALIDSKDDSKAKSTLEKAIKSDGTKLSSKSFKGVDYETTPSSGSSTGAFAVDDGLVIIGTDQGVKDAISARKGSALADASAYKTATGKVTKDGLALFYVDTPKLLDAAAQANPQTAALIQSLKDSPSVQNLKPTAAAMTVKSDSVAFEVPASHALSASHPIGDLPSDAWLALSVGGLGDNIRKSLQAFSAAGQAQTLQLLESQIKARTGLDLQPDLLSWLTDFSGFIAGTPTSFAAGAILGSNDPSASRKAVVRIGRALSRRAGLPVAPRANGFSIRSPQGDVAILSKGDEVIAALGKDAVAKTENPSSKLSSDPTFQAAEQAMGDGAKPALYLSLPTALQYAALGGSANDPSFQSAQPYLRHLTYLAVGTAQGGGGTVGRVVIGLK